MTGADLLNTQKQRIFATLDRLQGIDVSAIKAAIESDPTLCHVEESDLAGSSPVQVWGDSLILYAGDYVLHEGQIYEVYHDHTALEHQPPGATGMAAVYRPVELEHAGTIDDPIPWVYEMNVFNGKYYSYDGGVWRWVFNDTPTCTYCPGQPGVHFWERVE